MTIDAMHAYERRFEEVLALLDDASDGDGDIEELNANLEDALFVIHCIEDRDGEDEAIDPTLVTAHSDYRRPQAWYNAVGQPNPYKDSAKWAPKY